MLSAGLRNSNNHKNMIIKNDSKIKTQTNKDLFHALPSNTLVRMCPLTKMPKTNSNLFILFSSFSEVF